MSSHPITLNLGLFFDGTGLNRHNQLLGATDPTAVGSYASARSNVAWLFERYRHQAGQRLAADAGRASLALYIEGIGTADGQPDVLLAQATGRHGSGVRSLLAQVPVRVAALRDEFFRHNPARSVQVVELDLFGFSRGAAAARHLANDLEALAAVFPGCILNLNFIGLFDTVAGIWAPLKGNFSAANDNYDGLRLGLARGLARRVVQLVAADEYRVNFPLVASDNDVYVPGAHTDIGGGYRLQEREELLLERPFTSLEPCHLPDANSQAALLAGRCLQQQRLYWASLGLETRLLLDSTGQPFLPKRDLQRQKQVRAQLKGERLVRGELSRVYLRMMHGWALEAGVPLEPVPDDETLALPPALEEIAARLLARPADPGLDAAQMAVLRRDYIHLSAHWNAPRQSNSPLLDALYVHRPTADGRRVIHPNR